MPFSYANLKVLFIYINKYLNKNSLLYLAFCVKDTQVCPDSLEQVTRYGNWWTERKTSCAEAPSAPRTAVWLHSVFQNKAVLSRCSCQRRSASLLLHSKEIRGFWFPSLTVQGVTQRYDISNRNPTPRSRKSLSSLSTELRGRNGDTAEEGAEGRTERGVPCCETARAPPLSAARPIAFLPAPSSQPMSESRFSHFSPRCFLPAEGVTGASVRPIGPPPGDWRVLGPIPSTGTQGCAAASRAAWEGRGVPHRITTRTTAVIGQPLSHRPAPPSPSGKTIGCGEGRARMCESGGRALNGGSGGGGEERRRWLRRLAGPGPRVQRERGERTAWGDTGGGGPWHARGWSHVHAR